MLEAYDRYDGFMALVNGNQGKNNEIFQFSLFETNKLMRFDCFVFKTLGR